jgi:deazaflavin-dependent oxidoreductase (nitroreductase family)
MPLVRLARALGHKKWFARLGKAIVPLDKAMAKLTGGRVVALGLVPSLRIITIGKKSGQERLQPLIYVPDGKNVILIGSNWGGPKNPGWSYNLLAHPRAKVCIKGQWREMTARLVTGAEREALWRKAVRIWPAYDSYQERAAHRQIRVFLLTPDSGR